MRVAFAVNNNMITEHFGYCEYFVVYDISNNESLGSEIIKNPPHQKGLLPRFLKERNIDVIVAGNMGQMAVDNLKANNIEYYLGVSGELVDVLNLYLDGKLKSNGVICNQHMHHGEGHQH